MVKFFHSLEDSIFNDSEKRGSVIVGLFFFLISLFYVLTFLFDVDLAKKISLVLLLTGLVSFYYLNREYWFRPPLFLMLCAIVWVIVVWLVASADFPDRARSGPAVEDFIDKFLFIFIGLSLAGSKSREQIFLGVLTFTIIFLPWISGDGSADLLSAFSGKREGFGLNPIRSGMLAAFVLIMSGVVLLMFVTKGGRNPFVIALCGALICWSLLLVVFSQTRAVFIALGIILVFGSIFFVITHRVSGKALIRSVIGLLIVALLAVVSFQDSAMVKGNVERMSEGMSVIPALFSEDVEAIPQSSWGIRAIMLKVGLEKAVERPVWGWGYRSSTVILDEAKAEGTLSKKFSQFHNSYLELLVEYGIGGLFLLVATLFYLMLILFRLSKVADVDSGLPLGLLLFLSFIAIISLFDGILVQETPGPFIFNSAAAMALSIMFRHQRRWRMGCRSDIHEV